MKTAHLLSMLWPRLHLVYTWHSTRHIFPDKIYFASPNYSKTFSEITLPYQLRESLVSQVSSYLFIKSKSRRFWTYTEMHKTETGSCSSWSTIVRSYLLSLFADWETYIEKLNKSFEFNHNLKWYIIRISFDHVLCDILQKSPLNVY
jgi:hypothetical protein